MDYAEGRANSEIIASWASDHIAYGVSLEMFPAMFDSLEESLRELVGEAAWTPALQDAWRFQFDGLLAIIETVFQRFGNSVKYR
jgi:hemoglobin-like flavoprotein